ncbi:MAG: transposase [Rickettsiales bacterium]|jgi:transposase|nr:transposase [Rickettsiales bacterium]
MTNRREYTAEFKLEAVKPIKETGQASTKIAKDLGIDGSMLSKWVRKYDGKMSEAYAFPGKGKLAPYDKERFDLKKELARITRERDILKKALGYFAKQKE